MSNGQSSFPLTRFLTALAHSPALLAAFQKDPVGTARASGVTDEEQLAALESGDLTQLQQAVSDEVGQEGASATVGYWVMVEETEEDGGGPLPDWWVRR